MKVNKEMIYKFFKQLYGLKIRNIKQGHGSFVEMDFGDKDIFISIKTNKGVEKLKRGEWHLWITMCSWRIDEKSMPLAGCEDSRKTIEKALKKIENKKLINIDVLSNAYDMKLEFENSITFFLFSIYTEKSSEAEQWMLFTPDKKVLLAGPGKILQYIESGKSV